MWSNVFNLHTEEVEEGEVAVDAEEEEEDEEDEEDEEELFSYSFFSLTKWIFNFYNYKIMAWIIVSRSVTIKYFHINASCTLLSPFFPLPLPSPLILLLLLFFLFFCHFLFTSLPLTFFLSYDGDLKLDSFNFARLKSFHFSRKG